MRMPVRVHGRNRNRFMDCGALPRQNLPVSSKAVDYVVIGAGSAGCVVANRLSADAHTSVLVLEAGGSDEHWLLRMPLAFLKAMFQPQFTWNYRSEPEPALNGRTMWLPRGKVLGGTSSING